MKILLILGVLFSVGCTYVGEQSLGKDIKVNDSTSAFVFGISVDESIIKKKKKGNYSSCKNSQFFGKCGTEISYLSIFTEHPDLGVLSTYYIYDLSNEVYLVDYSGKSDDYITMTYRTITGHYYGSTNYMESEVVGAKFDQGSGIYYLGHVYIDSNWKITIKDEFEADVKALSKKYPNSEVVAYKKLDHVLVPLDFTDGEKFKLLQDQLGQ